MLSACHAPALPSPPSAQARKGARLFDNYIVFNLFPPGPQPFRAWVLGQTENAGAWNAPGLPELEGGVDTDTRLAGAGGVFRSTPLQNDHPQITTVSTDYDDGLMFRASWLNPIYGGSPTVMPPSINIPVIIYLGRPK